MAKSKRSGPISVATVIQKGGCGKTTMSAHLAHDLVRRGFPTLVIDCDKQGNIGSALANTQIVELGTTSLYYKGPQPAPAEVPKVPGMFLIAMDRDPRREHLPATPSTMETFRRNVQRAAAACGAQYVVFDTPPDLGFRTECALAASNYCFTPMKVTVWSIQGAEDLATFVRKVKDSHNPELTNLGVVVNLYNPRSASQVSALEQLREDVAPGTLLDAIIGQRSAIEFMETDGLPVWKVRSTAGRLATKEMRAALDELLDRMETL